MTSILWLASYPKSGNTWLRAFLANYLAEEAGAFDINRLPEFSFSDARRTYYAQAAGVARFDGDGPAAARLRPAVHRLLAAARPGRVFVKTHFLFGTVDGVSTICREVTEGAVYVVRNPLDMVVSFADYYGLSVDNAIRATAFPALDLKPGAETVRQRIGDWSSHVRSWTRSAGLRRLVIRYEDMLTTAATTFAKVVAFLGLASDDARLRRAIEASSFSSLAGQEAARGFIERSGSARRFFRRGTAGGWREVLSPAQVAAVINRHRPVMTEFGYLDGTGKVIP